MHYNYSSIIQYGSTVRILGIMQNWVFIAKNITLKPSLQVPAAPPVVLAVPPVPIVPAVSIVPAVPIVLAVPVVPLVPLVPLVPVVLLAGEVLENLLTGFQLKVIRVGSILRHFNTAILATVPLFLKVLPAGTLSFKLPCQLPVDVLREADSQLRQPHPTPTQRKFIIIIIITRPRAHTIKYNHQWVNLQMGQVQQCMTSTECVDGKDAHTVNLSDTCKYNREGLLLLHCIEYLTMEDHIIHCHCY